MKFSEIFLPFFLYAILLMAYGKKQCVVDGKCYLPEDSLTVLNGTSIKECDGSCFAFKCLNYTTEITYGAGCYEDFVNACKWVDPKIKEEFIGKTDYKYFDETALIVACEDGEGNCGITQLVEYEKGKEIEKNHGETGKNAKRECKYDNKPLQILEKRKCATYKGCESYPSFFDIDKYDNSSTNEIISRVTECTSPCTAFSCVSEGKYIVNYGGCYEEFERICTNIPPEALAKIKANKKNYFYYDENVIVATCTDRDDCHVYSFKAFVYDNYIFSIKRKFGSKILDKKIEGKCEYVSARQGPSEKSGKL